MDIASRIDSTLLRADARREEIEDLCREARTLGFAAVCVNPFRLPLVVSLLKGSPVAPCTVVAFPLGACSARDKSREIARALEQGARELDMVLNIGAIKDQDFRLIAGEVSLALREVSSAGAILKVILETSLLNEYEIAQICKIARGEGVHFVKTSTGFGPRGATVEDVLLLRECVGTEVGVKAAGGIREREFALRLIQAGADRLGTSNALGLLGSSA